MATFVQTKPLRKQLRSKRCRFDTFSPVNYEWKCARVRIFMDFTSRVKSMKRHKCFIPVCPFVVPAK